MSYKSYGGHYGPEFASYIQQQNAAISAKNVSGEPINLVAVGINNGWFDAKTQYRAYVDYSANNSYNQILSPSQYSEYMNTYDADCAPAVDDCYSGQSDDACSKAQDTCADDIENAIINEKDFDPYDVRQPENDPYPPGQYTTYLANQTVQNAIGAQSQYTECPTAAFQKFSNTGDSKYRALFFLKEVPVVSELTLLPPMQTLARS